MASNLGKRKQREEREPADIHHGFTLFVSNLPYTATSTDLQTLFSDIAPVRSAFVVCEHGTGVSKGVGYVSFAIKEDAQSAFDQISKEGIALVGRSLRIQWADNKPKEKHDSSSTAVVGVEGTNVTVEKKSRPKAPPAPRVRRIPQDPLAIRTLVVSGLPPDVDTNTLWKKMRKYAGAEKILEWPVTSPVDIHDKTTAHILFTTPSTALDAIPKLHAHVYKGNLLSVTLKKRLEFALVPKSTTTTTTAKPKSKPKTITNGGDGAADASTAEAEASVATAAPTPGSRLIIRNLPFNATDQDLRALFLPYGPIYSIHIPTATPKQTDKDKDGDVKVGGEGSQQQPQRRTKGFAFVWMLSRKDAERAIEGCNGVVVRAGAAREMVEGKQKRKKQMRLEKKMRAGVVGKGRQDEDEESDQAEGADENDGDEEKLKAKSEQGMERTIAVDWALSKDRWEEEKAKIGEDVEMKDASASGSGDDSSSSDSDSDSDSDSTNGEEEKMGVYEDDGDSDLKLEAGSEREEDEEEPVKPQLPPPETGTTLFVRNVPFTATEDELRTLFRVFGPLRYVRITIDPATGRSRGTAFACFWNLEDADKVVEKSELVKNETGGNPLSTKDKKNPFTLPSILTPDPSSTMAQSLVLHGRTLDVVRAVTRDDAGKLKEMGEKMREKADKRNMYLLREGVILPNSTAAVHLTPADIERRTMSFNTRRALLKSNPSLYISKTRLSVRQIPLFVSERVMKRMAVHAIRAFEKEVKEGVRQALSVDELARPVGDGDGGDGGGKSASAGEKGEDTAVATDEQNKKDGKKAKKPPPSKVKQAKIVRQAERVDAITGKGRSKGYGFLELNSHADALRVLRWCNNNPDVGPLLDMWWKEEVKDLVERESAKEEKDDKDETRLGRLKSELERLERGEKKGGGPSVGEKEGGKRGTLIVEFSIENVQVVQRRNTLKSNTERHPIGAKNQPKLKVEKTEEVEAENITEEPSPKRRRVSDHKLKSPQKSTHPTPLKTPDEPSTSTPKPGQNLGFVIGRKRKERKGGKGRQ